MSSSRSRRDRQRGSSIVEALVAAALLGITATVGITGWDTAVLGARRATHEAWLRCVARAQMEAILAAPWDGSSSSYPKVSDPSHVKVGVATAPQIGVTQANGKPVAGLQEVTVTVTDSQTGASYALSALKGQTLSGTVTVPDPSKPISSGCPSP